MQIIGIFPTFLCNLTKAAHEISFRERSQLRIYIINCNNTRGECISGFRFRHKLFPNSLKHRQWFACPHHILYNMLLLQDIGVRFRRQGFCSFLFRFYRSTNPHFPERKYMSRTGHSALTQLNFFFGQNITVGFLTEFILKKII